MTQIQNDMRVAYVVKRYPRYSETFIVNEILAHEAAGLEVDIFALRPPTDTHFQDIISRVRAPVSYLPYAGVKAADLWDAMQRAAQTNPEIWPKLARANNEKHQDVLQALVLADAIRQRGITHLHAHFATSASNVARLAALFTDTPYTLTAHAKDIFHEDIDPQDLKRKIRDSASVVTVSDHNVAYLEEHYAAAGKVTRIYNGLDLEQFRYRTPEPEARRIVAVGRLVEKKGFIDLVEACRHLVTAGTAVDCQIVGAGPLESSLRQAIEDHGLQDQISLIGPRPQNEIKQLVQQAAMMVAPCVVGEDGNRDGLPTVLLEAMALGTPCISTDVTGIPEVLIDQQTGLICDQHNPKMLAEKIEQLLNNPGLRVKLARGARSLIEQEFDVHRNAARVRDCFRAEIPETGARVQGMR